MPFATFIYLIINKLYTNGNCTRQGVILAAALRALGWEEEHSGNLKLPEDDLGNEWTVSDMPLIWQGVQMQSENTIISWKQD